MRESHLLAELSILWSGRATTRDTVDQQRDATTTDVTVADILMRGFHASRKSR